MCDAIMEYAGSLRDELIVGRMAFDQGIKALFRLSECRSRRTREIDITVNVGRPQRKQESRAIGAQ